MPEKRSFTKQFLKSLEAVEGKRLEIQDTQIRGLLVVVGATSKTFYLYRRVSGVPKRVKLGRFPDMTVEQARRAAEKAAAVIAEGRDPVAEKRSERQRQATLKEAFEKYLASRKLKPRTIADYREAMRITFADWLEIPLTEISRDMVERRHRKRSRESASRANHAMRVLRAVFNHATETLEDERGNPILVSNPVRRLSAVRGWNRVDRRQTVIKSHQLSAWFEAVMMLEGENAASNAETARDYFLFTLLTGLRKLESAKLTWAQVDLDDRTFTVIDTKNLDQHTLPLSDFLVEMLRERMVANGEKYVFPTGRHPGYFTDPRWWMKRVTEYSSVPFTIHDLRRTFATVAESLDISAHAIKRLLNHRVNKADVTAGYIVADVERLRKPMQTITDFLLGAGNLKAGGAVIELESNKQRS